MKFKLPYTTYIKWPTITTHLYSLSQQFLSDFTLEKFHSEPQNKEYKKKYI